MKYVYGTCTPYTIRNIIRRWNKTRAISMGHNSLSSCDIILVIDYIKMNCRCSKINYIELRLINNKMVQSMNSVVMKERQMLGFLKCIVSTILNRVNMKTIIGMIL